MALASFPAQSSTNNEDEAKNKATKRRFENDLMAMQSDQSKFLRNVEALEVDLRVLRKNYTDIGFAIKDKQEEVKKSQSNLQFLEDEIHALKKKIANL
jgi:peptidoglycan hydrolase CwlO-like protein